MNKQVFYNWGGWIFILLCIVLLRGYSSGMITLFALFCLFFLQKMPKLDNTSIAIIVFTYFYILFSCLNGAIKDITGVVIYGLPWFFFYNYGRYVGNRCLDSRSIVVFIILIAVFSGFPVYLSIFQKIGMTGSLVDTTRSFYIFGNENAQASGNGVCIDVFIGYVGLSIFFLMQEWKIERWVFLILFLLSLLVAINVVSRFPIVATALCFLIVVFSKYRKKPIAMVGVVVLVIGILIFLYTQVDSLGEIIDAYSARNEDIENVRTLSDRTYRWTDAFTKMIQYPMGWYGKGESYMYVHNMWLDIAKYAGIIPFVLLVVFTMQSFNRSFAILKIQKDSIAFLFLSLNICFFLMAFVQPVYGALSAGRWCLIWGLETSYLKRLTRGCITS